MATKPSLHKINSKAIMYNNMLQQNIICNKITKHRKQVNVFTLLAEHPIVFMVFSDFVGFHNISCLKQSYLVFKKHTLLVKYI